MTDNDTTTVFDGTDTIKGLLDRYHNQTESLHDTWYMALPYFWLSAAFRALEVSPTLYPVAIIVGHLAAHLKDTTDKSKRKAGGMGFGHIPFTASTKQLALLGMNHTQVAEGLKILKDANLVSIVESSGKPSQISICCAPEQLAELKRKHPHHVSEGPASTRRRVRRVDA